MKLKQGQIWKLESAYVHIVEWARLEIGYKTIQEPWSKEGPYQKVSKKEFCRLIKGGELVDPSEIVDPAAE